MRTKRRGYLSAGPFKSHEPQPLRNPRAIRLPASLSLGSSCRARAAAVHRPSLSTEDETPALKPFPNAGGSAAQRCPSRSPGAPRVSGARRGAEPGDGLPAAAARGAAPRRPLPLPASLLGRRQVAGFNPVKDFPAVVPRAIQLVEGLKKPPYPNVSLRVQMETSWASLFPM